MYNRYIPESTHYTWVGEEERPAAPRPEAARQPKRPSAQQRPRPSSGPSGSKGTTLPLGREGLGALFSGKAGKGLQGLLQNLKLENIDTGDVLLLLIVLYLLVEGDDLELVIALGLVLLMGLGGESGEEKQDQEKG